MFFLKFSGAAPTIVGDRADVQIPLPGDCNAILLDLLSHQVLYRDYRRGLSLLDPYGLDLDWRVMATAGGMGSLEMFLNFPVMDMNRNVLWPNPNALTPRTWSA